MSLGNYTRPTIEGCFNISPSSLHTWFDNKHKWYMNNVLNNNDFKGSTNTVVGNIVHYMFEMLAVDKEINWKDIMEYYSSFNGVDGVDMWYFDPEFKNLKNLYETIVDFTANRPKPNKVEQQTIFSPREGFSIGGTYDALTGTKITDYKTTSSFFDFSSKKHYMYQLITYAISLRANGIDVDEIEIVQIKRPDMIGKISEKTNKVIGIKPAEIKVISEKITDEMIMDTKEHLISIMDTLTASKEYPELTKLLFPKNPLSYIN